MTALQEVKNHLSNRYVAATFGFARSAAYSLPLVLGISSFAWASAGSVPSASESGKAVSSRASADVISTKTEIQTSEPRRRILRWKIGLDSENFSNEREHAQIVGLGLSGDFRAVLLPGFLFKTRASLNLQSGLAQSQFGDTVPHNGFSLAEAVLQARPWRPWILQIGALDESFIGSPFLPGGSFPGGLQKIAVGSDRLGFDLIAQAAIPTSTTLSTQTVENEPTPFYSTQGVVLKARPWSDLQLKASGSHYQFANLPSKVAFESSNYGNTVLATGANSSKFAYRFDGWMVGGESDLRLMRDLNWKLSGHFLQNTAAPVTYRNAEWLETGLEVRLPGDMDLLPKFASYFSESDVAPSFYGSSETGHNNRRGWLASMDLLFKQEKFKVGAAYGDAAVINSSPYQTRQQYVQLRFESLYEIL